MQLDCRKVFIGLPDSYLDVVIKVVFNEFSKYSWPSLLFLISYLRFG